MRAPASRSVAPVRVLDAFTTGNVSDANGLIDGHAVTRLTRLREEDAVPSLVIDFGQNLAGLVSITFAAGAYSTDGSGALPGLSLAFSETLQFLTDRSDFTRSDHLSDVSIQRLPHRRRRGTDCCRTKNSPTAPIS